MAATSSTITDLGSISAFNRGPLTSVFTPPATCLSTLTSISFMYFGHQGSYFDSACFPPSLSSSQTQQSKSDTWAIYYYSPGQCPSGWSHATTITSYFSGASESPFGLSLGSDTTAVLCCPSGYAYLTSDQGHRCLSTFLSGGTLTYFSPTVFQNSYVQGSPSTTVGTGLYVTGDGIPIWWQSSDLAVFSAASLTTSSLSSSTPTTTASSSPIFSTATATSTSSPSTPSPGSSGLSTGTKAAIGVCIPLAVIAILLGLFYYLRHRQRTEQHYQVPPREENFRDIGMTDDENVVAQWNRVH